MIAATVTALLALGVLAALVLLYRSQAALPRPLHGASLYMNEQRLKIDAPVALSGRVDQVWQARDGMLVVTDTKTRRTARVYDSDVVQLSAYAYMLRHSQDMPVHRTAYVRTPARWGSRFTPVELLPDEAIEAFHARYHAVSHGLTDPRCNAGEALCNHCGHRPRCPRWTDGSTLPN